MAGQSKKIRRIGDVRIYVSVLLEDGGGTTIPTLPGFSEALLWWLMAWAEGIDYGKKVLLERT